MLRECEFYMFISSQNLWKLPHFRIIYNTASMFFFMIFIKDAAEIMECFEILNTDNATRGREYIEILITAYT